MSPAVISVPDAITRLGEGEGEGLRFVDCRFQLDDTDAGERAFHHSRLPGAVYAHLDHDLSDHSRPAIEGRHPLPSPTALANTMARWGIGPQTQVVVYDAAGGALAAARCWWLMRWMGHAAVQVLDGGWQAWLDAAGPLDQCAPTVPSPASAMCAPSIQPGWLVDADTTADLAARGLLLDARAAPRYRGEVEPLDPKAGHIPGAINRPFSDNLDRGRFKPPAQLLAEYTALLGANDPAEVVVSCGSGVTACHDALAMVHAGLPLPRLFAPSWSGWVADPVRPVELG